MKIQFTLLNGNETVYESGTIEFTDAADAALGVKETIESLTTLTECHNCEKLTPRKYPSGVEYCKECSKLIPDDSDYSSSSINEEV